jgi:hypothetical protein
VLEKKNPELAPGFISYTWLVQETKQMQRDDDDQRNAGQPEYDVASHDAFSLKSVID